MAHAHDPSFDPSPSADRRWRAVRASTVIIAVNVAIYLVMVARGDNGLFADARRLVAWGANFGPLTRGGEWWRLLTATVLHGGLFHILLNMLALRVGGPLLEDVLGRARFIALYVVAGVGASLGGVLLAGDAVRIGASGAVFGVYGALLGLALGRVGARDTWRGVASFGRREDRPEAAERTGVLGLRGDDNGSQLPSGATPSPVLDDDGPLPHDAWRRLGAEIAVLFTLNVAVGLLLPIVDNVAHVTGFAMGLVVGRVAHAPGDGAAAAQGIRRRSRWLLPAGAAVVAVLAASVVFPLLPGGARLAVLHAACSARIGAACVGAGRLAHGAPPRDPRLATSYFERACAAGRDEGCLLLGRVHLARGADGRAAAIEAFTAACDRGTTAGCTALGAVYASGAGRARDLQRAAGLFHRACDAGDAAACVHLS
jgi:membrane associated rhomboid family serine protease